MGCTGFKSTSYHMAISHGEIDWYGRPRSQQASQARSLVPQQTSSMPHLLFRKLIMHVNLQEAMQNYYTNTLYSKTLVAIPP